MPSRHRPVLSVPSVTDAVSKLVCTLAVAARLAAEARAVLCGLHGPIKHRSPRRPLQSAPSYQTSSDVQPPGLRSIEWCA